MKANKPSKKTRIEHIKALPDDTPSENYDAEEVCPHCDHVNKVKITAKATKCRVVKCRGCDRYILLCTICEDYDHCAKCPYEKNLKAV